jgi:hypothetical protein
MPRKVNQAPSDVFINVPFDGEYEPLYIAMIAGLCGLGLTPRCVLEISPHERRIDRIAGLVARCKFSVHDLSRVELSPKRPKCPRFNMPFELGLACGLSRLGNSHRWIVFESSNYRIQKSQSDLNGIDPYIHNSRPNGVLRGLANAFVRPRQPSVQELAKMYRDLRRRADLLKRLNIANDLYDTRGFQGLVLAATELGRNL